MLRWRQRVNAGFRPRLGRSQEPTKKMKIDAPQLKSATTPNRPISTFQKVNWPPRLPEVRWLFLGSAGFLAWHIFTTFFLVCNAAYGISMLPTISSFDDYVFISKYYRRGRGVQVGDVVSFKHPVNTGESAVKRVVGMEGDFVLMCTPDKNDTMIQVPEGHCWVVGDNILHSRDSRMFGPLPLALIQGKVQAKLKGPWYRPGEFSWIEHDLQPAYNDDDLD